MVTIRYYSSVTESYDVSIEALLPNQSFGTLLESLLKLNKVPGTIKQVASSLSPHISSPVISEKSTSRIEYENHDNHQIPILPTITSIPNIHFDHYSPMDPYSSPFPRFSQVIPLTSSDESKDVDNFESTANPKTTSENPSTPLLHKSSSFSENNEIQRLTQSPSFTKDSPNFTRTQKFHSVLSEPVINLELLRKLSWNGIPTEVRAMVWKLLLGYLPTNSDRREATISRKQKEYAECIPKYYEVDDSKRTSAEIALLKQIQLDVPRTYPESKLFRSKEIQESLARVLYIWAIRHPASSYVQGINDLATPFYIVFLSASLEGDVESMDGSNISDSLIGEVEADTYWCMTKMLDGIQDNYTFDLIGTQRKIHKLSELIHRLDARLYEHFERQEVQFLEFSLRWMNCLLMREFRIQLVIRIWDTYFAQLESFSALHIYLCAALLTAFSDKLKAMEFQDMVLFLKNMPTHNWTYNEIELLLSQAFVWMSMFESRNN